MRVQGTNIDLHITATQEEGNAIVRFTGATVIARHDWDRLFLALEKCDLSLLLILAKKQHMDLDALLQMLSILQQKYGEPIITSKKKRK